MISTSQQILIQLPKIGTKPNEGDTLISAQTASAQIRMEDGGIIAMRPDTTLQFDRFMFNGQQDGTERSFFSLFKGGFCAITGLIGKINKANYRITTPASVIGVRGTDHETFVVTPDSSLAAVTPIGTYNKVNLGETSMTTEKGTVFVLPNQMGFAGAADQMPQLQPINLNIFTVTAQPAPQASGDKHEGNREGGREVRETSTMDKNEMRETTTMDKNEMRETTTTDKTGVEGAATLTPSTEDAVTNTIPKTTGGRNRAATLIISVVKIKQARYCGLVHCGLEVRIKSASPVLPPCRCRYPVTVAAGVVSPPLEFPAFR